MLDLSLSSFISDIKGIITLHLSVVQLDFSSSARHVSYLTQDREEKINRLLTALQSTAGGHMVSLKWLLLPFASTFHHASCLLPSWCSHFSSKLLLHLFSIIHRPIIVAGLASISVSFITRDKAWHIVGIWCHGEKNPLIWKLGQNLAKKDLGYHSWSTSWEPHTSYFPWIKGNRGKWWQDKDKVTELNRGYWWPFCRSPAGPLSGSN